MEKTQTVRARTNKKKTKAGVAQTGALTEEVITLAALKLLDREGLAGFTLRNLATSLGVFPASIYWYLPTKDDVAAAVVSYVLRDVVPDVEPERWKDYLRALLFRCREAIRAHPNVAPLLGAQLIANTRVDLRLIEGILSALSCAGFRGEALVNAYNATIAALVGYTTQEFSPLPETGPEWQRHLQERLGGIDSTEYPMLSQTLPLLRNRSFILRWETGVEAPLEPGFAFYVDAFIYGIERMGKQ